jgi:calcineurin-like phosphoesterase family protein
MAALLGKACGGAPPATPTSPSGGTVQVTASFSPAPMLTRSQDGTVASRVRYQIAGELTFRSAATFSGRITSIDLTIMCKSGEDNRGTVALDIPIAAGSVTTYPMAELVQVSAGQEPQRLRMTAKGTDRNGVPFEVAPLEVALVTDTRTNGEPDATVLAAGDIALCGATSAEATAKLFDRLPGTVFALGDNVYPAGTSENYTKCYAPSWGRHRDRTRPAPGNHEYDVTGAAPYFAYFGAAAGPAGLGYYSFNLGAWHILSLNSNVVAQPGSPQYEWARNDLDANASVCTLAYWHHPLFSSGGNGNNDQMREIWRLLDAHRAEVVLVGHDHDYERFAPQNADGVATSTGVREFVVGTGGANLRPVGVVQPNSEIRENQTWGVLKLTLRSAMYNWEFVPIDGQSFHDFGTTACVP